MDTYAEVKTVASIGSYTVNFTDGSGVHKSVLPNAKVGQRYRVTINANTNETISITRE